MFPGTISSRLACWTRVGPLRRESWIVTDIVSSCISYYAAPSSLSQYKDIVFLGASMILNSQSIQTYVVHFTCSIGCAYTLQPLFAVSNLIRYLCSLLTPFFFFTQMVNLALVAIPRIRVLAGSGFLFSALAMYGVLGHGKDDTILAAFAIVVGCSA